jgi:carbon monoxide dehydrogenase subunit G
MAGVRLSKDVELQVGPDVVWAVISDFSRFGEWNPTHVGFPDGPPQLRSGLEFTESVKVMGMASDLKWSVDQLDQLGPPFALRLHAKGPMGMKVTNTFRVVGSAEGSRVEVLNEVGGAAVGAFGAMLVKEGEKNLDESVDRLKTLVE